MCSPKKMLNVEVLLRSLAKGTGKGTGKDGKISCFSKVDNLLG